MSSVIIFVFILILILAFASFNGVDISGMFMKKRTPHVEVEKVSSSPSSPSGEGKYWVWQKPPTE